MDVVENSLPTDGNITIQRGGSAAFSLKLHARAIGRLSITISAVSDGGESDVVRKPLFVKVKEEYLLLNLNGYWYNCNTDSKRHFANKITISISMTCVLIQRMIS